MAKIIFLLNNLINELFEISNKTNYQEIKESISVYINLVRQLINMIALSNQEVVQILAQIENQEELKKEKREIDMIIFRFNKE